MPYGSEVLARAPDAVNNKARNERASLTMANNKKGPTETTENRQSFTRYNSSGGTGDSKEMVEKLKATNFKMGFLNRQGNLPSPTQQPNMQV